MNTRITDKWGISAAVLAALLPFMTGCGGGSGGAAGMPPSPTPAPYVYQAPAENADSWQVADAGETGMSESGLEAMMHAVRAGEYPIIDAIAIAHAGKLVFQETIRTGVTDIDGRVGNTDPAMHRQYSVTKSFASALVGIAIDQGIFEGTGAPYLSLFSYGSYANPDPRKNAITLHDVLTMRLGIDWDEWDPPYSDPANQLIVLYETETDYSKALLDLPMASEPGSQFAYNTVATVSLGQAIENNAPLSLVDYGLANLLGPLGISRIEILQTPTGLPNVGGGLYLTARDALKIGQLYLDGGTWNGERIVSSDWISQSLAAYTEIGWGEPEGMAWKLDGYGYHWWLGHFDIDGERLDSFAAWGYGEQWVIAVPALELVVAINAHGFDGSREEVNQALGIARRVVIAAMGDI
jgi:CubicO group peptidase (beta-lactamase class C family)